MVTHSPPPDIKFYSSCVQTPKIKTITNLSWRKTSDDNNQPGLASCSTEDQRYLRPPISPLPSEAFVLSNLIWIALSPNSQSIYLIGRWLGAILPHGKTAAQLSDQGVDVSCRKSDKRCLRFPVRN